MRPGRRQEAFHLGYFTRTGARIKRATPRSLTPAAGAVLLCHIPSLCLFAQMSSVDIANMHVSLALFRTGALQRELSGRGEPSTSCCAPLSEQTRCISRDTCDTGQGRTTKKLRLREEVDRNWSMMAVDCAAPSATHVMRSPCRRIQ